MDHRPPGPAEDPRIAAAAHCRRTRSWALPVFSALLALNVVGIAALVLNGARTASPGVLLPTAVVALLVSSVISTVVLAVIFRATRRHALALAESDESAWTFLAEHARDVALMVTLDGVIAEANEIACRTLGYSRDELLGQPVMMLHPPHAPVDFEAHLAEIEATGRSLLVSEHQRADGSCLPVEIVCRMTTHHGVPHLVGTARDVSARKNAETALQENQRQFDLIMRKFPGMAFSYSRVPGQKRVVHYLSEGLAKLLGEQAAREVGRDLEAFRARIHPDDLKTLDAMTEVALREKKIPNVPYRVRTDRGDRWVRTHAVVTVDDDGTQHWYGMIIDVHLELQETLLTEIHNDLLEMIAESTPLAEVLEHATGALNRVLGTHSAVLLFDRSGSLTHLSAPSLSETSRGAIDCLTRAHGSSLWTGPCTPSEPYAVEDAATLPEDTPLRALAGQTDTRSFWSEPLHDAAGRLTGVVIFFSVLSGPPDPNDTRLGQRVSRLLSLAVENQRRLRKLRLATYANRNTHDAIYLFDDTGKILDVNDAACRTLGYSHEQLTSMRIADVDPSTADDDWGDRIRMAQHLGYQRITTSIRSDGSTIPVEVSVSGFEFEGESLMIAVVRDLSERHAAEDALRQTAERLDLALKGGDLATWDSDLTTNTVTYNARWFEITGTDPSDNPQRAKRWKEYLHPDDVEKSVTAYQRHLRGETETYEAEVRVKSPAGGWIWVLDRGRVVERAADGTPTRAAGTILDITARVRLQNELQSASTMRALGEVASGVAHDFSSTFSTINTYLETVRRYVQPESEAARAVRGIEIAADRAAGVSRTLLTFARGEPTELSPVDLGAVGAAAVSVARDTFPAGIDIGLTCPDTAPVVLGDRSQLYQLLMNLLKNARDAVAGRGRLEVSVRRAGRQIELSVSDDGEGVDEQTLQRVREPFFTTKTRGLGTGLGLAVVDSVVRGHGGELMIQSAPGIGTTVRATFQATEPLPAEPGAGVPIGASCRLPPQVMVCAQNRFVRGVIASLIESLGPRTVLVGSTDEAASRLADQPATFDGVVVDLDGRPPDADELLGTGFTGTVVALTSELDGTGVPTAPNTVVLRKPFELHELERALRLGTEAVPS